jgi:hypothetical protein
VNYLISTANSPNPPYLANNRRVAVVLARGRTGAELRGCRD